MPNDHNHEVHLPNVSNAPSKAQKGLLLNPFDWVLQQPLQAEDKPHPLAETAKKGGVSEYYFFILLLSKMYKMPPMSAVAILINALQGSGMYRSQTKR